MSEREAERKWFLWPSVRKVIDLSNPTSSRWRIKQIYNDEEAFQKDLAEGPDGDPSCAALRVICQEVGNAKNLALMRIYMQIPDLGTDIQTPEIRAQQATSMKPRELAAFQRFAEHGLTCTPRLLGYREDQQDDDGLVPGGFVTYVAWEIVPGRALGDDTGSAATFWDYDDKERGIIRSAFQTTFLQITSAGFWPLHPSARNLIWDSATKTMYWVGFLGASEIPKQPWSDRWLPAFKLVDVPDDDDSWMEPDWDGDTSRWKG